MKFELLDITRQQYGLINVLGYEESEQRGYLTFTCGQGTYVGVLAKHSEEAWFYKYEKRSKFYDY